MLSFSSFVSQQERLYPHAAHYQAHIDGLRALAVLAVILFHIDPNWVPGGFAGVDVFFTISGYLITGIVCVELQEGRFSAWKFYERRMRRILPALWVLLVICIPISFWLLLPAQAEPMAKSALWSILSLGNIYFWHEISTDYFAPESSQMPFLHLWSLGVEEQFYLLWPLILASIWKLNPRKARVLTVYFAILIVIVSTALAEFLLENGETSFAYYMLPTRAGELALGGALALIWPNRPNNPDSTPRTASSLALMGWVMLIYSFLYLDEKQPFPGLHSVLPIGGAALLIATGRAAPNCKWPQPLCHPFSIWFGRSSYSAYLWHWPILAWWRYIWGDPSHLASCGLFALIVLLAGVSQRWVEMPARKVYFDCKTTFTVYFLIPIIFLGSMALIVARGERWGIQLYSNETKSAWARLDEFTKPAHHLDWVCQQHILDPSSLINGKCEFGGNVPASVLLLGDSQAAAFAPLVRKTAEAQGVKVRSIALGSCAAIPGALKGVVSTNRLTACEEGIPKILKLAEAFPLLIIGGAWETYSKNDSQVWNRLEDYLKLVTSRGQKVILLPHVPIIQGYDANCPKKRLRVGSWLDCPETLPRGDIDSTTNWNLNRLAKQIPGVIFLSFDTWFCQETHCPVADKQGHNFYADPSHISIHGANLLADTLIDNGDLPDLRLSTQK